MREALAALLLISATAACAQPAFGSSEGTPQAPWRVAGLPQQKPPLTRYEMLRDEGRLALRITAQGSYGNLVFDQAGSAAPRTLRWRWKLEQANTAADLRQKSGDDAALKVCLAFDMPLDQVPFVERQLMRLARSRSGELLPAATLCWVWDNRLPASTLIHNAYTSRVRFIVLRSGGAPSAWVQEQRDVAADFVRAFGEEAPRLPPLAAWIVSGDADNTGMTSIAWLADLKGEP